MKKQRLGFTLMELMIVLAIVGILAALAYPSYRDSVRKGNRAEAITALHAISLAQEKWRANNATYATNLTASSTATPPGLGLSAFAPATGIALYALNITAANVSSFSAQAEARGNQVNDKAGVVSCTTLTLNQNGPNYGTGTPNQAACWGRN